MDSSGSDKVMTEENESPKVWTQLSCVPNVSTDVSNVSTDDSMAEWSPTQTTGAVEPSEPPGVHLQCLESGDGTDYSVMAVVNADRIQRPYCPSHESRQLHNHKERLRRSRMKCSCDALRALVPGVSDKTDKATVLEHTVSFLFHLSKCSGVKCDDYLPTTPPPMSAKLLDLYPTLLTGEYRYYDSIPNPNTEFESKPDFTTNPEFNPNPNDSHIIEVHESNGTQYVTTSDGFQYMIVDGIQPTDGQLADGSHIQYMDTSAANECATEDSMAVEVIKPKDELSGQTVDNRYTPDECQKCVERVVDMVLSDDKENIDPNAVKPVPKRRGRKPKHKLLSDLFVDNCADDVVMHSIPSTGHKQKRKYRKRKPKVI